MNKIIKFVAVLSSVLLSGCDVNEILNNLNLSDVPTYSIKDEKVYTTNDIYDDYVENGGLTVSYTLNKVEYNVSKNDYTYVLNDSNGSVVDSTKRFESAGDYKVSVTYNDILIGDTSIKVEDAKEDKISLSHSSISLKVDEEATLVATVDSDNYTTDDVEWESSNKAIASVNNGLVKGLKVGQTVITAKIGSISESCNVTVSENDIKITNVSVSPTSKTLSVNETVQLNATIEPSNATNQALSWSSSSTMVATVSTSGLVTAKSAGTATIKARANDGSLKNGTCTITVTDNTVSVQSIELDKTSISLNSGENETISATVLPSNATNKTISWSTSNSSIATVSNGVVSAKSAGNVTITAKSTDGSNIKATCSVTVTNATVEATGISVSPVSKTMEVGDSTTLSAVVKPDNATNKNVSWSSSNNSTVSVSDGTITANAVGTATITASTNNGKTATCSVTVTQKQEEKPIDGDQYKITFSTHTDDGSSALTSSTITSEISNGLSYISSFLTMDMIYAGQNGLKIGSRKTQGELEFSLNSTLSNLDCNGVKIEIEQYSNLSGSVNFAINSNSTSIQTSDEEGTLSLTTAEKVSTFSISGSTRFYLKSIAFYCVESTPIDVESISIPTSKNISINNSETLSVTYTPSNANRNKTITWSTSNSSIATVSNGVVTGISEGTATITATSANNKTATCSVNVSRISVTSVSLSSTSESISVGSTKQLSATVYPTDATNKEVSWSSSNSTVASVSTSGLVTAKATGTATITVKTTDGNKTAACSITVTEQSNDKWTIMIYMCGSDLESDKGLATSDIDEILSVANQPDDVNIIIEAGGAKSWSTSSFSSSYLNRAHIANKKVVLDSKITKANMGKSATFQSFLEWGLKEYPAEKTGVILWNHGGAMYGCCCDENYSDDCLTNSETKTAITNAYKNTGTSKLEFIGYDCCLMQVQDIAEFNSAYFNYMIASEESESGYGWDYDTWIDDVYSNQSTETILKSCVDGFITDNGGASSRNSDQTLSYLDLNKMSDYKTAFENFASALSSKLSSSSVTKSTFASWVKNNVKHFCVDDDSDQYYFCEIDVKDFVNKVSNNSSYNPGSTYISSVTTAFSSLVKYSVAQKGAGNSYGLGAIYCSASTYSSYIKSAYTSSETNFTKWLSFCKSYSYLG